MFAEGNKEFNGDEQRYRTRRKKRLDECWNIKTIAE